MSINTLPGITAKIITTERITTRVLFSGPADGIPVLFLHGNVTTATWWEEVMITLPDGFRGIAPDQRGYGAADPDKKIDATRGMSDHAEDALSLLDHLGYEKAHIVGNSMGGSILWWMLIKAPQRFLTATVVDPGSPFGFGGTKDEKGTPCFEDYAGSGAALSSNPEVIRLIKEGYRGAENEFGLRFVLRTAVYRPPFIPEREEDLLTAALSVHLGEKAYPGDTVPSPNWPYFSAGRWGAINALSGKYAFDIERLITVQPKPDILWIRGRDDLVVADGAASCPAVLGAMGLLPDYPGPEVYPPQPMIGQTRYALEQYAADDGAYEEIVIDETAHVPFIEKLEEFNQYLHSHLDKK
jgi:pimeloyl-ACP methyl ester carboxylesterase